MFKKWIQGWRQRSEIPTDSPSRSTRFSCSSFSETTKLFSVYSLLRDPYPPRRPIFPQPRRPRFPGYHPRPKFLQPELGSDVDIPDADNGCVVIYFTSVRFAQKIFEECRTVKSILRGFGIPIDKRNLAMTYKSRVEIMTIFGTMKVKLPQVFIGGKYIGGAEEIKQLQESGELKKMIDALPRDEKSFNMRSLFQDFTSNEKDQNVDQVEKVRYRKQATDSCGFHFDDDVTHPVLGIFPLKSTPDLYHMGDIGLHCYNIEKGTNLQFKSLLKCYAAETDMRDFYLTLEVMDPVDNSVHIFETRVWHAGWENETDLVLRTIICRIKPQVAGLGDAQLFWDFDAIDNFYKGDIPGWLPDDALTGSDKLQYYELTESDIEENEWLKLYAENVLFSVEPCDTRSCGPIEMKKIVVQTKEEVVSSMKLKSNNAIFYLDFKAYGDEDIKGVIRKTMDGRTGHVSLHSERLLTLEGEE